ncbi:hypothetical protein [Actinomadura gamaensis]|uniref:Uncharacterized protein n=1 Tax=Actinomadura gamaensis TaxID=1763541 RepID=A0ABV9UBH4_9ACTN
MTAEHLLRPASTTGGRVSWQRLAVRLLVWASAGTTAVGLIALWDAVSLLCG